MPTLGFSASQTIRFIRKYFLIFVAFFPDVDYKLH